MRRNEFLLGGMSRSLGIDLVTWVGRCDFGEWDASLSIGLGGDGCGVKVDLGLVSKVKILDREILWKHSGQLKDRCRDRCRVVRSFHKLHNTEYIILHKLHNTNKTKQIMRVEFKGNRSFRISENMANILRHFKINFNTFNLKLNRNILRTLDL